MENAKIYVFCTHKSWNVRCFINSGASENGVRFSTLELGRKYLKSQELV